MQPVTVSEVNARIKALLEADKKLSSVLVSGEISNYKRHSSGHHYFSLKDAKGVLSAVMYLSDASRLTFRPVDGMRVLASGQITVYLPGGKYQLRCQNLLPDGAGALQMAYEELYRRLEAEGLFAPEHKKKLPRFPERIVLITSPTGAAVRDMIRILGRRWPLAKVLVLPVRVQGQEAPGEIAEALRICNQKKLGDVIITGRGGGSLEDLWAFNDEGVARAIFASVIPVVSAVGHEPDVTIADYAADVRAATPSNAAEITVPDQMEWQKRLLDLQGRLPSILQGRLQNAELRLKPLLEPFRHPGRIFDERRQYTDRLCTALLTAWERSHQPRTAGLAQTAASLDALSPLKVLARGYAVCETAEGGILRKASDIAPGQELWIRLQEGRVRTKAMETESDRH